MIWRCGETVGSHCSDRSQRSGDGLCGVHNGLRLLLRLRRRLLRRRPLQAWCGRERCAGAHVQLVAELQYLAHGLHTHMHTSMVLARYVSTYACTCYTYTHAYVHVHPCVCACASHVHVHVHVHAHPCMCMCMCIACMCMCMCMCGLQRAQQPQRRRVVDVMHGGDGGEHCVLAVCAVGDVREHRVAHRPPPLVGQQHRLRRAGRRRARRRCRVEHRAQPRLLGGGGGLGRGGARHRAVLRPRHTLAHRELADSAPALLAVLPLQPR